MLASLFVVSHDGKEQEPGNGQERQIYKRLA